MKRSVYTLLLCLSAAALGACSTTKRIPEGEYLYTGVRKITIEADSSRKVPSSVESAVKDPLSVKPNNPLYSPYIRTPIPTGLWAWNYLYTERKTGFKAWLFRRLAKEPVLVSKVQPELRTSLVEDILDNHGYFGSWASHEIIDQNNPKKKRISYRVHVARPWFLRRVEYPAVQGPVTERIGQLQSTSNIKQGAQYNIDTMTRERVRITNILRNEGYYYFRPDYIEYLADTTRQRYNVDLRMVMAGNVPEQALQPYTIGRVAVSLTNPLGGQTDTLTVDGINVTYQNPLKVRPKVLSRRISVRSGQTARLDDINNTLTNLIQLGVFRNVIMEVPPLDSLAGRTDIDMVISAALDQPLEAKLEADLSSKSNSFLGPGLTFGVRHKNLFNGGEVLDVTLNGSYEWQTGNTSGQVNSSSINSYEFGINGSLMFPRIFAPVFINRSYKYPAKTTFNLGASILNRPKFFTMLSANVSAVYDFQSSGNNYHSITPFKLTYNYLLRTTQEFSDLMNGYTDTDGNWVAGNEALKQSFDNQFIPSISYTYTYDKRYGSRRENRLIWQNTITEAGNILAGIYSLAGSEGQKTMFGLPFSQFVKGVSEFRLYRQVGNENTIALRVMAGAGYAYGNSSVMPYSEQFFIGGANSIRAFTIRSIGPGSYHHDGSARFGYFDSAGDLKFEINAEFRFGILGGLKGAVFIDAGNIWLLKDDPVRPGGQFRAKNFLRELATGTGVGLRYDLSFLVVRADLGIGIHAPYDTGKSGYYNIPRFTDGLGFHLAIGYPF